MILHSIENSSFVLLVRIADYCIVYEVAYKILNNDLNQVLNLVDYFYNFNLKLDHVNIDLMVLKHLYYS
jgi:hypothetical protein